MLPPPQKNPYPCPNSVALARERKKWIKKSRGKEEKKMKSMLSHVLEGRGWVTGRSGLWLWLQLRNSSQGYHWFFKKKNSSAYGTVYYLNRDNPVPNCPNSYAPPNAGRPSIQWASGMTVHIPWLVDSYDMHKGKRWLNSNPQTTGP